MMTKSRRWLAVGFVVIISFGLLVFWPSSGNQYRAESLIMLTNSKALLKLSLDNPNVFYSRPFEEHAIKTIPEVIRLKVVPMINTTGVTNVGIYITTAGLTDQDARQIAEESVEKMRKLILSENQVYSIIIDAPRVHSYSFFLDSFVPGIKRLFQR